MNNFYFILFVKMSVFVFFLVSLLVKLISCQVGAQDLVHNDVIKTSKEKRR